MAKFNKIDGTPVSELLEQSGIFQGEWPETEQKIRDYFTVENMIDMFGARPREKFLEEDFLAALADAAVEEWKADSRTTKRGYLLQIIDKSQCRIGGGRIFLAEIKADSVHEAAVALARWNKENTPDGSTCPPAILLDEFREDVTECQLDQELVEEWEVEPDTDPDGDHC